MPDEPVGAEVTVWTTRGLRRVAVGGARTFRSVSAGGRHTCGITTDGALYCWGANWAGQLGTGSYTDSPVPVRVTGSR
jgi:alpha-tubulin suppressor-like RCC1 family protein